MNSKTMFTWLASVVLIATLTINNPVSAQVEAIKKITYSKVGSSEKFGEFVQTGGKIWEERNGDGEFEFSEVSRTGNSITLQRGGGNLEIDLDTYNIIWLGSETYRVLSTAGANGMKVNSVTYSKPGTSENFGKFVQTKGKNWEERNGDGEFEFTEVARTENVITLQRSGSNLEIDLATGNINWGGRLTYSVMLTASTSSSSSSPGSATYAIVVHTGSATGMFGQQQAGTDSNIKVRFHGAGGHTGWGTLTGNFEAHNQDQTSLSLKNVGVLSHIEIQKDGAGPGPDWYPVAFSVNVSGRTYTGSNRHWVNTAPVTLELR